VVDIEQRALRALEQDSLALAALGVEQRPHRIHVGQHLVGEARQMVVHTGGRNLGHAETAAHRIVVRQ
jgi:hypothetical protein